MNANSGPQKPGYVDKSAAKELRGRIWDVLANFSDELAANIILLKIPS